MIQGILHIDLDAFFVSVEQVLNPDLCGKPVIVGGRPDRRGVVATASYEARKFGVHSAMPLSRAYQLCPQAIFLQGNYSRYVEFSDKFMAVLSDFTPTMESGGLDEAYLDITGCDIFGTPKEIAQKIKRRVKDEIGLTCSVGISKYMIVAKIASDLGKPDGLLEVLPGTEKEFLAPLAVGKMPGVGVSTEKKLRSMGIRTIGDIAGLSPSVLKAHFGSYGAVLQGHACGIDNGKVQSRGEAKSISRETTFGRDIIDRRHLHAVLRYLSEKVGADLREYNRKAKSISLKLRFSNFETINRSKSLPELFDTDDAIYDTAAGLLDRALGNQDKLVRLIGVELSNLNGDGTQLGLFDRDRLRQERRSQAIDEIRKKYGFSAVQSGRTMALKQIFED
jgi:DNA polymerase IV